MTKILDITKNVADLCKQYPELKVIMADLGFKDITKPLILNTMGKMTTIPRGAVMKNIPMDKILTTFAEKGFTVINVPGEQEQIDVQKAVSDTDNTARESDCVLNDNEILLKSYIKRLTEGEDIEVIREEFVKNFSDVSAIEIARAEQSLMKDGTSLSDVQKLCDVHSALFHGATSAERIANAEKEVERSAKEEQDQKKEQTYRTGETDDIWFW